MPEVLEPALPSVVAELALPARRPVYAEPSFLLGSALYLVSTVTILISAWILCGHRFIYPLDDVYINMAVAKNFATHGVWGVTPYEFNSTTSSPLYVLILSGIYRIAGVNDYAPLALSWLLGYAAIYLAVGLIRSRLNVMQQSVAIAGVVLLTPLFVLGTIGMEHALHVASVLFFLTLMAVPRCKPWHLALATAIMCAARYEGLLIAAAATLILLISRRWLRAAVVAVSAWVPVAVYARFSLAHGGSWLPNSVLLKGVDLGAASLSARLTALVDSTTTNASTAPHLAFMAPALLILAVCLWRSSRKAAELMFIVGGAALLHLVTASVGWVFRYESYLIAAGIVVLAYAWADLRRLPLSRTAAGWVLLSLALAVLLIRTRLAAVMLPQYSQAIYRQQWQMARFLKQYYPNASVAANDIGLINYETDLHCLDLAGLASSEIFNAKRRGQDTTAFLEQTARAHHVQVIMLYESWFSDGTKIKFGGPDLPESWDRVSQWTLPERLQLGDRTVSFFGTDEPTDEALITNLKKFEPSLPTIVKVSH